MAIKPCRECKAEVSTEAKTCPKCGTPAPTADQPSRGFKIALGAVFGLFAVCVVASSGGGGGKAPAPVTTAAPTAPKTAETYRTLNLEWISKDYADDKNAAAFTLTGKIVIVTAEPTGAFMKGDKLIVKLKNSHTNVDAIAVFDPPNEEAYSRIRTGGRARSLCTVDGVVSGALHFSACTLSEFLHY